MTDNNLESKENKIVVVKYVVKYIWIIGWLFTLGIDFQSFLGALKSTDFFGQLFLILVSYVIWPVIWPVILGYYFR